MHVPEWVKAGGFSSVDMSAAPYGCVAVADAHTSTLCTQAQQGCCVSSLEEPVVHTCVVQVPVSRQPRCCVKASTFPCSTQRMAYTDMCIQRMHSINAADGCCLNPMGSPCRWLCRAVPTAVFHGHPPVWNQPPLQCTEGAVSTLPALHDWLLWWPVHLYRKAVVCVSCLLLAGGKGCLG